MVASFSVFSFLCFFLVALSAFVYFSETNTFTDILRNGKKEEEFDTLSDNVLQ